jgi:hypothetical protein
MRRMISSFVAGIYLLTTTACGAGWHHVPLGVGPMDERQQVRVWHGGEAERWHAVVLTADSVLGVPWREAVSCDGCRVGLARTQVDSLQAGNPTLGFWKSVGLGFGLVLGALFVLCEAGGCPSET